MPDPSQVFAAALADLESRGIRRRRRASAQQRDAVRYAVDDCTRISFASNDYLGLAQHPALIDAAREAAQRLGVGATASPLICGHSPSHAALEDELARFVGLPRAIYFYAGYAANVGTIPALVERSDAIISDALNHACLIDGARLSRAELKVYAHNDLAALERALVETRGARRRLVIADAVFSMDGDLAPLPEMLALCERHDAWLMVDDAHGFGVLGEGGRGSLSHWFAGRGLREGAMPDRLIYMATLGKAAGVAGAFVAAAEPVIEWLVQRARTYFFATGAPPMVAETLRAALRVIESEGWRRERLAALRERLAAGLAALPWDAPRTCTAIQPVVIGDNARAMTVMAGLEARGLWVPAIRPPTVPEGTARLRITLSAAHADRDVDALLTALGELSRPAQ